MSVSVGGEDHASSSNEMTVLHVSNLSRNVKESHLREIFASYGDVQSVELEVDRRVGLPLGYAYVKYSRAEDAEDAAAYMNGGQIDGMTVKVSFVLIAKKKRESPGRSSRRDDGPSNSSAAADRDRGRNMDSNDKMNTASRDQSKHDDRRNAPVNERGAATTRGRSRSRSPPRRDYERNRGPPVRRDSRDRGRRSPSPPRRTAPYDRRTAVAPRGRSRSPPRRNDSYRSNRRSSPVGRPRSRSRDRRPVTRSTSRSRSPDRRRRYSRSSSRSSYTSTSSSGSSRSSYSSRSSSSGSKRSSRSPSLPRDKKDDNEVKA